MHRKTSAWMGNGLAAALLTLHLEEVYINVQIYVFFLDFKCSDCRENIADTTEKLMFVWWNCRSFQLVTASAKQVWPKHSSSTNQRRHPGLVRTVRNEEFFWFYWFCNVALLMPHFWYPQHNIYSPWIRPIVRWVFPWKENIKSHFSSVADVLIGVTLKILTVRTSCICLGVKVTCPSQYQRKCYLKCSSGV